MNFQIFKLVLEKAKEPEIKLPTSAGSSKKQEFQKNIYFCFCVDHNKLWKILKEMGTPDHLPREAGRSWARGLAPQVPLHTSGVDRSG